MDRPTDRQTRWPIEAPSRSLKIKTSQDGAQVSNPFLGPDLGPDLGISLGLCLSLGLDPCLGPGQGTILGASQV